ncbi:MAG TPA: co-chaperone DjlA [Crenotrichaceae bacterium]|nr:co-chaperone DjlA [Crenotrichaceae bacterium]
MSWTGKIIGGAIGLIGGPAGALIGVAIGHQFDKNTNRQRLQSATNRSLAQQSFFEATFLLMGHLAKADGLVSKQEIELAKSVMDRMKLSPQLRQSAMELFRQGKDADFVFEPILNTLYQNCAGDSDMMRLFLEFQLQTALSDGRIDPVEEAILQRICECLSIPKYQYFALKMAVEAYSRMGNEKNHYSPPRSNKPDQLSMSDAYAVLGVSRRATDKEIEKAYRRRISQNHPDKLAAKGLPDEMIKMATEKTRKIREAYEMICKSRN